MSEALSSVGAAGISALGSREIDSQNMRQVANLLISVLMEVQRSRIDTAYQDAANQLDSQNLARALSALSDGEESSKFRNYVEELIDLLGADANLLSAFKSVSGDSQEFQTLARRADGVEKPEEHGGDYFVRNAMNAESREEFNNCLLYTSRRG